MPEYRPTIDYSRHLPTQNANTRQNCYMFDFRGACVAFILSRVWSRHYEPYVTLVSHLTIIVPSPVRGRILSVFTAALS